MVHRIVQFALASLLTTSLAAGAAWAQDEPAGEDPAADPAAEPTGEETGGEAGGEAAGGMEEGGGGEMAAEQPKQLRFGVSALLALPLGDLADVAGFGIGILGGVVYGLSPKLALAGHVGLVYHLPKEIEGTDVSLTLMEIPILAGVRFMVIPKLALGADTGINIMRSSSDAEGAESESNTRIPLALHAGYMLNANMTVGGGLWIPNLLLRDSDAEEDMQLELFAYFGYLF